MDENKEIEQLKKNEEELKKELEAVKAEKERLEESIKFTDKLTGLWNRKYAEKILSEGGLGADKKDFSVICTDISNMEVVNKQAGQDAGDEILINVAEGLEKIFGEDAICCKLTGTKMCVFTTLEEDVFDEKIKELNKFFYSFKEENADIELNFGTARRADHNDKDGNGLLKEAEYSLQMQKLSNESKDDAPVAPRKRKSREEDITILMIDDSLVLLRTLQTMLKDTYKLLMSTAGMEGYEIAQTKHPDIILLDYNMPVVDGARIFYLLKQSNKTKDIPVIFISGVSDKEKILKVASLKPAGYLLKPVEKDNLLNTINTVLQTEVF